MTTEEKTPLALDDVLQLVAASVPMTNRGSLESIVRELFAERDEANADADSLRGILESKEGPDDADALRTEKNLRRELAQAVKERDEARVDHQQADEAVEHLKARVDDLEALQGVDPKDGKALCAALVALVGHDVKDSPSPMRLGVFPDKRGRDCVVTVRTISSPDPDDDLQLLKLRVETLEANQIDEVSDDRLAGEVLRRTLPRFAELNLVCAPVWNGSRPINGVERPLVIEVADVEKRRGLPVAMASSDEVQAAGVKLLIDAVPTGASLVQYDEGDFELTIRRKL